MYQINLTEQVHEPVLNTEITTEKLSAEEGQLSFFEEDQTEKKTTISAKEKKVLEKVRELDILDMTPMQAMNILYELHKKMK